MTKELIQKIINKTTAIVSNVICQDIVSEIQAILDDNIPDEDKINNIYCLKVDLSKGKLPE